MNFSLAEVFVAWLVLMFMFTMNLSFFLPCFIERNTSYDRARHLLLYCVVLFFIHFVYQYYLLSSDSDDLISRTLACVLFSFPVAYFFNMSLIHLQYSGKEPMWVWSVIPILFIIAVLCVLILDTNSQSCFGMPLVHLVLSVLYGVGEIFSVVYFVLGLKPYREKHPNVRLSVWLYCSVASVVLVGLSAPFVIYFSNEFVRYAFWLLLLNVVSVYIVSFITFGMIHCKIREKNDVEDDDCTCKTSNPNDLPALEMGGSTPVSVASDLHKADRSICSISSVRRFVDNEIYCRSGLTLLEAAIEMQVSPNTLKAWLRDTEFKKFNTWILYLRVEKAKYLLLNHPELKNIEISEMCGFCDRQYFQRQFYLIAGTTPSKWLKEQRSSKAEDDASAGDEPRVRDVADEENPETKN